MSQIETRPNRTDTFKYTATIYNNDDKFCLNMYTLEGIKKLKAQLDDANEVYGIYEERPDGELIDLRI